MGGSGGIASLFAMGMASSFINSFAPAAAVVMLIVVLVGDVTVAVVGAIKLFVATPGGDVTWRLSLSMSIASSAVWMVCGLWMGKLRGLRMAAAGDMQSAKAILWRAVAVACLCLL